MLQLSNAKAYAVLSILIDLFGEGEWKRLVINGYENGREHGFHIWKTSEFSVSFSEDRGTDAIVVYFGSAHRFMASGNAPDEDVYQNNRKFFAHDEYLEVAKWIQSYLTTGKTDKFNWRNDE